MKSSQNPVLFHSQHRVTSTELGIVTEYNSESLDRLYPLPNIFDSFEDFQKGHCLDLIQLEIDELFAERRCVLRRLDYEVENVWLTWRRQRVEEEILQRRRGGQK